MSDAPSKDQPAKQETQTHDEKGRTYARYDSGGSGIKWIIGAGAAAALLGGGYFALKHWPQGRAPTEVANVQSGYDTAPTDSVSLPSPGPVSDPAAAASNETLVDTPQSPPAAKRVAPRVQTASDETPEQVIGVTPSDSAVNSAENEVVVTANRRPVWTKTPNTRRLAALYPARALERGREGEASVHCTVKENGGLDCVRTSEFPANSGFGTAALRVASRFRHAPQRWDGSAAAGTPVNLRVVFRIEDEHRRG